MVGAIGALRALLRLYGQHMNEIIYGQHVKLYGQLVRYLGLKVAALRAVIY